MAERVWDQFLTDRDKEHAEKRGRKARIGFGKKPAILLIDLYRAVFGDKPQPLLEALDECRRLALDQGHMAPRQEAEMLMEQVREDLDD